MEITPKILFSLIGGFGVIGLLWAVFKFIIISFFENIKNIQNELITAKNDHSQAIGRHCERLDDMEKDISDIVKDCKDKHK